MVGSLKPVFPISALGDCEAGGQLGRLWEAPAGRWENEQERGSQRIAWWFVSSVTYREQDFYSDLFSVSNYCSRLCSTAQVGITPLRMPRQQPRPPLLKREGAWRSKFHCVVVLFQPRLDLRQSSSDAGHLESVQTPQVKGLGLDETVLSLDARPQASLYFWLTGYKFRATYNHLMFDNSLEWLIKLWGSILLTITVSL